MTRLRDYYRMLDYLGEVADPELKRPMTAGMRLGKPQARKAIEHDPDLGKISDSELAKRHYVNKSTVADARKRLGIPKASYNRGRSDRVKALEVDHDLGKIPDSQLAKRHGVVTRTVRKVRKRLGAPAAAPDPRKASNGS